MQLGFGAMGLKPRLRQSDKFGAKVCALGLIGARILVMGPWVCWVKCKPEVCNR